MFKKFKSLETSKKMVLVVTLVWVLSIIIGFIGMTFGFDYTIIINIVNLDFLVLLGYYFGKAGMENVTKIINSESIEKENKYDDIDKNDNP